MAKTSVGPKMPAGAQENGGNENSKGLDEARNPGMPELVEGPVLGERGEFKPAAYKRPSGNIRIDS